MAGKNVLRGESHMSERDYKLYAYRWVVLGVFMFINSGCSTLP